MRGFYHRVREHPQLQRRPALAQFIKFSIVGSSNTAIDFGLFVLLTRVVGAHYLVANIVSFTVAASWSYVANRTWTFRDTDPHVRRQYLKFLLVSAIGLGLTSLLLLLLIGVFGLLDILGKGLAVLIVLAWNFTVNRRWTFRRPLARER